MRDMFFKVTGKHVRNDRFDCNGEIATVSAAPGHEGYFFCKMPPYGCSKDYRSPEIAITAMLADHAVSIVKIERVGGIWVELAMDDYRMEFPTMELARAYADKQSALGHVCTITQGAIE
jgi:hypothetical protein